MNGVGCDFFTPVIRMWLGQGLRAMWTGMVRLGRTRIRRLRMGDD
jgi:hypothetical protein